MRAAAGCVAAADCPLFSRVSCEVRSLGERMGIGSAWCELGVSPESSPACSGNRPLSSRHKGLAGPYSLLAMFTLP